MYYNPFPEVIRKIRLEKKLTQEQLAERMGVQQSTISSWENGRTRPNLKTEQKIFRYLETTNAQIGSFLHEIVVRRFGYDRGNLDPQSPPPGLVAKVEVQLKEVAGSLSQEDLRVYEKELLNVRNLEADVKQLVWTLEDRLDKELEKAGKDIDEHD